MADSSSDSDNEDFTLYKDRPEWKDVIPVEQDDGPYPVVKIAYSERFQDVFDYFRAVLRSGEKSQRAIDLTTDAIKMNPANYTVWHHRRVILKAIGGNLKEELLYITRIIQKHPKNYQVWYHRQMIVDWLKDGSLELEFTASILSKDAKNYHAWQHRQWAIRTFSLWSDELTYTEQLINEDIRNNSAWNQRFFVVSSTTGFTPDVLDREIQYTQNIILKARNNESPWNYLRGLVDQSCYAENPSVEEFCKKLYNDESCRSPYLLSLMVDIAEEKLQKDKGKAQQELDSALEVCASLALEFDNIRSSYWTHVGDRLEKTYRSIS